LLDAHQLAHAHPSGSSADIIAGQILPFAPEPVRTPEGWRMATDIALPIPSSPAADH
jgi:hypothetical protein